MPKSETRRFTAAMLFLTAALLAALFLNIAVGSVSIPLGETLSVLGEGVALRLTGSNEEWLSFLAASPRCRILFSIRLPRMALAAVLGGALSLSGYLLQVFFRNPIAGPFVLGISSGAKMTVGIVLILFTRQLTAINSFTLIVAAFVGALLITAVVLLFSKKMQSMTMLLVVGIMVSYICGAVTDLCIAFADDREIANLTGWSMGSFSGADWGQVQAALCFCLPGFFAALFLSKPMAAYSLGEGYAATMGVKVVPFRVLLLLLSSLLSACVTALAGPVSFVGIAVPHISRSLLKTGKPILVIPVTILCGAVFCLFCDLLARTLFAPTELSIGTVTAVFGAPVVISVLFKRHRLRED